MTCAVQEDEDACSFAPHLGNESEAPQAAQPHLAESQLEKVHTSRAACRHHATSSSKANVQCMHESDDKMRYLLCICNSSADAV